MIPTKENLDDCTFVAPAGSFKPSKEKKKVNWKYLIFVNLFYFIIVFFGLGSFVIYTTNDLSLANRIIGISLLGLIPINYFKLRSIL